MKKIWVYLLGILSGVVLTILVAMLINAIGLSSRDITYFDEPGDVLTKQSITGTEAIKSFEVFQAFDDGYGLASGDELFSYDLIVLLVDPEGKPYYDGQKVRAPQGKCFRQIGLYRYKTKDKRELTVPIVTMMDGEFEEEPVESTKRSVSNNRMTFFDEPGDIMSETSFKVSRVVSDGAAIARGATEYGSYYGLEVLLWDENAQYYDDQIIKASSGKCFRQIGLYKQGSKTDPIVALVDK